MKNYWNDFQTDAYSGLIAETVSFRGHDGKQVNGYWTTLKMTMTNVQTNHKTVYEVNNLKYDEKVNESYFTVSALEREQVK